MINRSHASVQCHPRFLIRTVKGDLPRNSAGTVVSVMENLGRLLSFADWDEGFLVPVFPGEIEVQRAGRTILPRKAQNSASISRALQNQLYPEICWAG